MGRTQPSLGWFSRRRNMDFFFVFVAPLLVAIIATLVVFWGMGRSNAEDSD